MSKHKFEIVEDTNKYGEMLDYMYDRICDCIQELKEEGIDTEEISYISIGRQFKDCILIPKGMKAQVKGIDVVFDGASPEIINICRIQDDDNREIMSFLGDYEEMI